MIILYPLLYFMIISILFWFGYNYSIAELFHLVPIDLLQTVAALSMSMSIFLCIVFFSHVWKTVIKPNENIDKE